MWLRLAARTSSLSRAWETDEGGVPGVLKGAGRIGDQRSRRAAKGR